MSRTQALVVLVAVALAVVLAGVGLYANAQPGPYVQEPVAGSKLSGDEFLAFCGDEVPCSDDDHTPGALRPAAARWWWIGAGAVLILGAVAVPLTRRRSA
jgi:hypothetical protein